MTTIEYVKRRGTCVKCKGAAKKNPAVKDLIAAGALFWTVRGDHHNEGTFDRKFHYACFIPKEGRKWPKSKLTEFFLESVKLLRPDDQKQVMDLFEDEDEKESESKPIPPLESDQPVKKEVKSEETGQGKANKRSKRIKRAKTENEASMPALE